MKKITLLSLITIVFIGNLISQAPNLMSYQAVIWDASGNLVAEKMVSIKISILQGSVTGTSVYSETHRIQNNINGLVSLMIGGGTNATGKISDINWGGGSYFLKTETDPTGGVNFSITSTTQLVSVPYSMFSGVAGNISTKNTGLPGQTLTIDKDGKLIWVGTNIPTVVTGGVTSITQTDSKVSGIVTSDGGSTITTRGFVWSTNSNPTITLSTKTSDGTGVGTYSSSITGLNPNTKYYIRAYASNNSGTGYGNDIEFVTSISNVTMGVPCPGTPTVKDIDDNTYNTVQIGTQCWMRENLKVTKYKNGEKIANVLIDRQNATIGAWSYYLDDSYYNSNFGKLYNWYAATDTRGICPNGWHMPSPDEWQSLRNFLGEQPGTQLKDNNPTYWTGHYRDNPTNSSGFSARGAGIYYSYISKELKESARFWSDQAYDTQNANLRVLSFDQPEFPASLLGKGNQISVRCLKDTLTIVSIPILSTTVITSITSTSATSGGNITSDGGASITTRGVVWSTSPTPTISLSTKTTVGTGIGSFTSLLTNLIPKTTYYVRAYATNSVGTSYGNEISFTTKSDLTSVMGIPCPGTPTVKDIDGNIYNTIQIGTQCWTKENLRVSRFKNGNSIPLVNDNSQWIALTSGARSWYQNDSIKYAIPYGNYYNSFAIKDDRGICPINWHVPNIMEFDSLVNFLGGYSSAGSKMKYIGPNYWVGENTIGNNESGFSAIPGGYRTNVDGGGYFSQFGSDFWLLLLDKNSDLHFRSLHQNSIQVHNPTAFGYYNHFNKNTGVPVRCLKNQ